MIVTVLVENEKISKEYKAKHGLCLYIETKHHRILFDLGPDDSLIHNANKLDIDLKAVDTVIISHGHKDHGGGLKSFLSINKQATIYIHERAFLDYYTSIFNRVKYNVGLDKTFKNHQQLRSIQDYFEIDDELFIFSEVKGKKLVPLSNKDLYTKTDKQYKSDLFEHEQHLIITENGYSTLVVGCAHRGIVNIIQSGEKFSSFPITTSISGMHLYNPISMKYETNEFITDLAQELSTRPLRYYTCHCTGKKAFEILEKRLGQTISYLSTGARIEI